MCEREKRTGGGVEGEAKGWACGGTARERVSKGMREGWREEEDRMGGEGWLAEGKY